MNLFFIYLLIIQWTTIIYKIKIKFTYDQQLININTLTKLKFSIVNSTTNEHIKHFQARSVIIEGSEVSEEYEIDNVEVNDGDFSLNHSFTNYGNHQIILRIDTNSSIIAASLTSSYLFIN